MKKEAKRKKISYTALYVIITVLVLLGSFNSIKQSPTLAPTRQTKSENSSFSVHFIDVGQADSILVLCDGEAMLVDAGESSDSQLIYTYLKNHNIDELKYLVMTHPHSDHIGGIPGALHYARALNVLSSFDTASGKTFEKITALLDEQNTSITVPTPGDIFLLGSATVEVVGPVGECSDVNNSSLILRVEYGKTSFLLTGDAGINGISNSINAGYYIGCDVYKVGHHGSSDSLTENILDRASPKYAVISSGKDNTYGHPTQETLSLLKKAGVKVLRTDLQGDIVFQSDGNKLTYTTSKDKNSETDSRPEQSSGYVLNNRSMKFHLPSCSSVKKISQKNSAEFDGSREELIKKGYSPCSVCKP